MKAILVDTPGPESRLRMGPHPMPQATEDELLVRVHATALNRADLLQRQGRYNPPEGASKILGLEMAGEVAMVGAGCKGWKVGDRVCGLLPGGGYAEFVAMPAGMALRIPPNLTYEEAAAIPEVFLTAHQALFWLGEVQRGHRVLIHAGASGVGTAAIQLAKAAGAEPIVTASTSKLATCELLGAALAIDYTKEHFAEAIEAYTDGEGVNVLIDVIGATYFHANLSSLSLDGVMVVLAMMGGSVVEEMDLRHLFRKRIHLKTSTLRSRTLAYKIALTQDFAERFFGLFETGKLRPVIDKILPWSNVEEAHAHMAANKNIGKIVLRVAV